MYLKISKVFNFIIVAQQQRIAAEKRLLIENQVKEEADAQKAFEELDLNHDGKYDINKLHSVIGSI